MFLAPYKIFLILYLEALRFSVETTGFDVEIDILPLWLYYTRQTGYKVQHLVGCFDYSSILYPWLKEKVGIGLLRVEVNSMATGRQGER